MPSDVYKFVTSVGRIAFPLSFDYASSYDELGWASVRSKNQVQYINADGQVMLVSKHKSMTSFDKHGLGLLYCPKGKNHLYGMLTTKDEWFIEPIYEGLGGPSEGVFCASIGNHNYILDSRGKVSRNIAPYRFLDSHDFDFGQIPVGNKKEEVFFMDVNGKILHGPYFGAQFYCDGLAWARLKEDASPVFLDTHGYVAVKTDKYDYVCEYWRNGLLQVQQNGLYGVIGKDGEFRIDPIYDEMAWLSDGFFIAKKSGVRMIIDSNGNATAEIPRDVGRIARPSEGVATYEKSGSWGYLRLSDGSFITDAIYEDAGFMRHQRAPVVLK